MNLNHLAASNHRISRLRRETDTLRALVLALVLIYPDRPALATALEAAKERALASMLAAAVEDADHEHLDRHLSRVLAFLRDRQRE